MKLQQAIALRISELARQQGWTLNRLAERSGISSSTLNRTVKSYATVKNTTTDTIQKLCYGLGISFREFWNSPLFDDDNIEYDPGQAE